MKDLRAIMVCVDYADILAVTLPYNRHHFSEIMVVTTEKDKDTQHLIAEHEVHGFVTDAFTRNGATFNKWLAVEEGIDRMGRHDDRFICLMDADVLWPKVAPINPKKGELWAPLRRMAPWPLPSYLDGMNIMGDARTWQRFGIHRNIGEWAGYSQIFHQCDPVLEDRWHWHETDWEHAGGADSIFQRLWSADMKRRPSWDVLHLGEPGQNWYGRATPLADGSLPVGWEGRRARCADIWPRRRALRQAGADEAGTFRPEKLGGNGGGGGAVSRQ